MANTFGIKDRGKNLPQELVFYKNFQNTILKKKKERNEVEKEARNCIHNFKKF